MVHGAISRGMVSCIIRWVSTQLGASHMISYTKELWYNETVLFANGMGDQDSIPDQVIPRTQKNGT